MLTLADQMKWLQAESAAAVSDLCKLQRGYAEVEHETYETRHKCAELEEKLKKKSGGTRSDEGVPGGFEAFEAFEALIEAPSSAKRRILLSLYFTVNFIFEVHLRLSTLI